MHTVKINCENGVNKMKDKLWKKIKKNDKIK